MPKGGKERFDILWPFRRNWVLALLSEALATRSATVKGAAFTLFERLEAKLEKHPKQLTRACVELAKDWRTDKYLRRLEALLTVADSSTSLLITGMGDVLDPEGSIIGIGSGGNYALSAAKALIDTDLTAEEIALKSLKIAGEICVFTNSNVTLEKIEY